MAEYIEREAAERKIMGQFPDAHYPSWYAELLKEIPAADVVEFVHGRWLMCGGRRYCSVCQQRACVTRDSDDFWYTVETNYCHNCGAKMDGERKDK